MQVFKDLEDQDSLSFVNVGAPRLSTVLCVATGSIRELYGYVVQQPVVHNSLVPLLNLMRPTREFVCTSFCEKRLSQNQKIATSQDFRSPNHRIYWKTATIGQKLSIRRLINYCCTIVPSAAPLGLVDLENKYGLVRLSW